MEWQRCTELKMFPSVSQIFLEGEQHWVFGVHSRGHMLNSLAVMQEVKFGGQSLLARFVCTQVVWCLYPPIVSHCSLLH